MEKRDFTNQKIGKLTVIEDTGRVDKTRSPLWKCKCDCGNYIERSSGYLRSVKTPSCGCVTADLGVARRKDITGERFGRLVAIEPVGIDHKHRVLWKMKCDCGNEVVKSTSEVTRGKHGTRSCGCSKDGYIGNSEHGKKFYKNLEKNYEFGTNMMLIRTPDTQPHKNNTSGYQGVSFISSRNHWRAELRFQGVKIAKDCYSLEEAIQTRKNMRASRDAFIEWYDSLTEEQQKEEAKKYKEQKHMFKDFYKRQVAESKRV